MIKSKVDFPFLLAVLSGPSSSNPSGLVESQSHKLPFNRPGTHNGTHLPVNPSLHSTEGSKQARELCKV